MSTESATRRKKPTSDTPKRSADDDHRRKRRNRMTQSCLNCHTSKRMCDRKRPCGRCTQLGLTGLCVYEVDDPNQRHEVSDEQIRLQKRVAELESVIRELKNKPHPKWAQPGGCTNGGESQADPPTITVTRPTSMNPNTSSPFDASWGNRRSSLPQLSPSTGSPPSSSPSPLNTPSSPLLLGVHDGNHSPSTSHPSIPSVQDLTSLLSSCYSEQVSLDGLFDSLGSPDRMGFTDPYHTHNPEGHCGCLNDVSSYNVVLELSLRLRRAADILGHSPQHANTSGCSIHQRIASLDRFASEALGNVNTSNTMAPSYNDLSVGTFLSTTTLPAAPGTRTGRPSPGRSLSPHLQGMRSWDFKASSSYPSPPDDALMSWEPSRLSPSDWIHPSQR